MGIRPSVGEQRLPADQERRDHHRGDAGDRGHRHHHGALAGVLINSLANSARSHERLLDNGATQRIAEAWAKDVQSVDPHGVEQGTADGACFDPSAAGPDAPAELVRATFNWDLSAGGADLPKAATWVLVEDGSGVSLVRRYCEDGFRSETVLAKGLDLLVKSTAHGPDAPDEFCPVDEHGVARTCTLVVPELGLDLTVTRRVPNYDANTLPTGTPPPPAIYAHDARYQYLNVRFKPSAPQPVTSYRLELRKGSPTAAAVAGQTKVVTVTQPVPAFYQVTFTGLDVQAPGGPPVNYYVVAVAINDMGEGVPSDAYGPMNPQPTGPDAPATPTATRLSNGCVRVAWSPSAVDGGSPRTGFRVWGIRGTHGNRAFRGGCHHADRHGSDPRRQRHATLDDLRLLQRPRVLPPVSLCRVRQERGRHRLEVRAEQRGVGLRGRHAVQCGHRAPTVATAACLPPPRARGSSGR
ncbi:MAG: fibronectin type III domain-containing protein [Microthrixaceae bacterium]|nr:fibronectin type III domain-containing protein [Microthrixaceae bacterium]